MKSPTPPLSEDDRLRLTARLAAANPKKGLGQHFLVDDASLAMIADAAQLEAGDTVLEIGPGLGSLTLNLTRQAKRVVAVEADADLAEQLGIDAPDNLEIVAADIMDYSLAQLPKGYKVVANIPYYLTSKLIRHLLENSNRPTVMSLLVQKEVAERIVAEPGQMSILAISVQYYAHAKIMGVVERHKFWPAPEVDSAILLISPTPEPAFAADAAKLFRLIKAGFGERRKQLKNSLAGGLNASDEVIAQVLKAAKIKPSKRAQELSLTDWQRLYQAASSQELI